MLDAFRYRAIPLQNNRKLEAYATKLLAIAASTIDLDIEAREPL